MRRLIVCLTTTLCLATGVGLAACAQTAPPSSSSSSSSTSAPGAGVLNPANIKRIRSSLPVGYEIADVAGPVSAAGLWGFGSGWTADPPQCAGLADPAPADHGARGYSASGAGGTLYVVVAVPAQPAPDDAMVDDCARWTMTFAHTTGDVTLAPASEAPGIDGARTVAMTVTTRTVVESGTEVDGQAVTAQAYADGHVVYVTLVTDPGSPHPALDSRSVGELLVASVAALRG